MANELPLPDHLQHLVEKRSGRNRRRKDKNHGDHEDDQVPVADRRLGKRDRRGSRNLRDLLDGDEDDD
ncbi:MAG: hypothetical protein KDA96_06555 [Planctomycetaceae bacterium]|nr:hypothetical protein [Planctomycetaceae bacterium]